MNGVYLKVVVGERSTGKTLYILNDIYKNRGNQVSVCIGYLEEFGSNKITPWDYYESIFDRGIHTPLHKRQTWYDKENKFFSSYVTLNDAMKEDCSITLPFVNYVIFTDNVRRDIFKYLNYNTVFSHIHKKYPHALLVVEMTTYEYFQLNDKLMPHIIEWRKERYNG